MPYEQNEQNEFQNGALIDARPESEKEKDFKFEEVVAVAAPVNWFEKPQTQWRKFSIFNQNGSGSCVAQTQAKELGIMQWLRDSNYVHFSATDIYQRRANKPGTGMAAVDARKIATQSVTLETLTPSQSMTDAQMDATFIQPYKREVGKIFKVLNYVELPLKDIDVAASVIQKTGKAVMVWFYFQYNEWTDHPTIINPILDMTAPSTIRHSVAAVDFTLVNGKKSLIIEDSWGPQFGFGGQRVIDEDFYKKRNFYSGYLVNFSFGAPQKPVYTFNVDMQYGQTNNDIIVLQDCLKYEGLFPSNAASTGFYGSITRKAVEDFQTKYNITTPTSAGYGRVGPLTRAKLNEIFNQ